MLIAACHPCLEQAPGQAENMRRNPWRMIEPLSLCTDGFRWRDGFQRATCVELRQKCIETEVMLRIGRVLCVLACAHLVVNRICF